MDDWLAICEGKEMNVEFLCVVLMKPALKLILLQFDDLQSKSG